MRLVSAATSFLFLFSFSFLSAFAAAEAVEPNSCAIEGRALSVQPFEGGLGVNAKVVFETAFAKNDSALPCLFQANEEVAAVYSQPLDAPRTDLREGDSFSGKLAAEGDEWNQTNRLTGVVLLNPSCAPLENCGVDCGASGFAKNARGCYECACSALPVVPSEKFYRFSFAAGWNYYSYPLAQDRDAYCLPSPDKPCLQGKAFLPRIVAADCDSEATLWRWTDGGKTYSEFQFPDVGKKEGVSFAGELFAGYWFKAGEACSVTIAGGDAGAARLDGKQLFKGWNSLGAPAAEVVFENVKGDCVVEKGPYAWDAQAQKFVKAPQLEPGAAYFVKVKRDCWLSVQR